MATTLAHPAPISWEWMSLLNTRLLTALALATVGVWSYASTCTNLIATWNREPDYSHGFLVLPVALVMLWLRRDSYSSQSDVWVWPGILLIALSALMRWLAVSFFIDSLDSWSIPIWVAGVCWICGGWPLVRFCLPATAFLFFMCPLPWKAETLLSLPLQAVVTDMSCWLLQVLGQPAVAQGHTILLQDLTLEVEQACSGLRTLVGILALAGACLGLLRQSTWHRVLMVAGVVPIALITNALRITATGLLHQAVSSEAAHSFSHDLAGWLMIPTAACFFAILSCYLNCLFIPVERVVARDLIGAKSPAADDAVVAEEPDPSSRIPTP